MAELRCAPPNCHFDKFRDVATSYAWHMDRVWCEFISGSVPSDGFFTGREVVSINYQNMYLYIDVTDLIDHPGQSTCHSVDVS